MRIGIDVDETLCYSVDYFIEDFNKEHKTNYTREDAKTYDFINIKEFEPNYMKLKFFEHFEKKIETYEIIENTKEILEKLKKEHNLLILTARSERFSQRTINWLKKNYGLDMFHDILFTYTDEKQCKGNVCLRHNIDILIDDAPHHSINAAKCGVKVLLMDRPWNKDIDHENIVRVSDWEEILTLLNE